MGIERTINVVNEMVSLGVIKSYALGGATAVIFYTEPIATEDVDIFVHLRPSESIFTEFQPIYDFLRERGDVMKGEHHFVEGFPIQFLPAASPLLTEAVDSANVFDLGDSTEVRVMTPEHLVTIMLQTGRAKDFMRIGFFLEHDIVDLEKLDGILKSHDLADKWTRCISKFKI